jgi:hypothetical protein
VPVNKDKNNKERGDIQYLVLSERLPKLIVFKVKRTVNKYKTLEKKGV